MANSFYTRVKNFPRLTRARGSDVRDEFDTVQAGFDSVETETNKKVEAPDAASGWSFPTATGNGGKFLQIPSSGKVLAVATVSDLGSGLVLDEDNFDSNSETDAPSQRSTDVRITSRVNTLTTGKQTIWVPAAAMIPAFTSGCAPLENVETTAGRPDMNVLDFDNGSDEYAQFSVAMPKGWNEGTVTFQAMWTTTNTGTDGVAWALQGVAASDNDTIDVVYGTAVVVTDANQGAAEDLLVTAESSAVTIAGTPAEGDLCFFQVFRDVSDAADDMTEDARLLGIKLFFTTDAPTDD